MKYAKIVVPALFVLCLGPAKAGGAVSYAIEPSRFDFVTSVSLEGTGPFPVLEDSLNNGSFDVIVCNQSSNTGHVVAGGPDFNIAPNLCRLFSNVKKLQLDTGKTPGPLVSWHGVIYGRFH